MVETCQSSNDNLQRLATFTYTNDLTGLHAIAGNTNNLTIYSNMLVVHQLTSSSTSRSNAKTEYDVVKTALQVLKKNLTSNATGTSCLFKHQTELLLQNSIGVTCLLLLGKHNAILGSLAATIVSVLTRREIPLGKSLVSTKDRLTETAGDSCFWSSISSHNTFCFCFSNRSG